MPLSHPIFNSTLFTSLMLIFILIISLFFFVHHTGVSNVLITILQPASDRGFNNPVSNTQVLSIVISAYALFGYSTMFLSLAPIADTWGNLGMVAGTTFLFLAAKYLLVFSTFETLYPGAERGFMSRYHQFTVLGGLLCLIGRAILSYTIDYTSQNAVTMAYIIGIIYCICASYIFYTTFIRDIRSIFRLFLYLCTLEIIPTLVYIKALSLI